MLLFPVILAAAGAVGLAIGTHLQHRAVSARATPHDTGARVRVVRAFADPAWLLGTAIIVLSTVLNIVALGLAPIALVQPIGAIALICAAVISARALGVRMNRGLVRGIALAGLSVAVFVWVSAGFVLDAAPTAAEASRLAWLLAALVIAGAVVARSGGGHMRGVVGAGMLFGAVAATVHVVAGAVMDLLGAPHGAESAAEQPIPLALLGLLVLLLAAASALGAWLVQSAYASGPPETVLAGLTVIDPLVAVLVGAVLLGEYAALPPYVILCLAASGLAACVGIALIVKHHPAEQGAARARLAPAAAQTDAAQVDAAPVGPVADGAAIPNRRS